VYVQLPLLPPLGYISLSRREIDSVHAFPLPCKKNTRAREILLDFAKRRSADAQARSSVHVMAQIDDDNETNSRKTCPW